MMGWADISTAPRDGTRIMLWCGKAQFGRWSHRISTDNGEVTYENADWSVEHASLFGSAVKPTLWMPIPECPFTPKADNCHSILIEELRRLDPENPRLRFVEEKFRG